MKRVKGKVLEETEIIRVESYEMTIAGEKNLKLLRPKEDRKERMKKGEIEGRYEG